MTDNRYVPFSCLLSVYVVTLPCLFYVILFMPLPTISHWRHPVLGLSMRKREHVCFCGHILCLLIRYLNCCCEFAVSVQLSTNMNLLHFEVKTSKVKVTSMSYALFRQSHTDQQFAIEDSLVSFKMNIIML